MSEKDQSGCALLKSRTGLALLALGAVAGFFLISEHQAHLRAWLPFLFLLACPLMHVFMHRGHGGQGGHTHQPAGQSAAQSDNGSAAAEVRHPVREERDS